MTGYNVYLFIQIHEVFRAPLIANFYVYIECIIAVAIYSLIQIFFLKLQFYVPYVYFVLRIHFRKIPQFDSHEYYNEFLIILLVA